MNAPAARKCSTMATPERAAFLGIGRGAELIEQHQRIGGDVERHLADVGDVRGERAQILLDRLVVADIGEHLFKQRELGLDGGNGQRRLRHQAEQSDGLQGHRLAAGIGTADQQRAAVLRQFQTDRHGGLVPAAQHVLEQRMARVFEQQAVAEARDDAIELAGEAALREDQLEFRHRDQRLPNGVAVAAQAVGHLDAGCGGPRAPPLRRGGRAHC